MPERGVWEGHARSCVPAPSSRQEEPALPHRCCPKHPSRLHLHAPISLFLSFFLSFFLLVASSIFITFIPVQVFPLSSSCILCAPGCSRAAPCTTAGSVPAGRQSFYACCQVLQPSGQPHCAVSSSSLRHRPIPRARPNPNPQLCKALVGSVLGGGRPRAGCRVLLLPLCPTDPLAEPCSGSHRFAYFSNSGHIVHICLSQRLLIFSLPLFPAPVWGESLPY